MQGRSTARRDIHNHMTECEEHSCMAQVSMWQVVPSEARDSRRERQERRRGDENAVREYTVAGWMRRMTRRQRKRKER